MIRQILKNIKKGATVERTVHERLPQAGAGDPRRFTFSACRARPARRFAAPSIKFAKELDTSETIQVPVAHAYPGTELHEYANARTAS